ncbi:hypothetical protein THASP1DRAFT_24750 [Thamnocephalis sphaerospora]|uniref:Uncharacterized protein n=1 Tax=Thamnocephalis sphaerospora TaxID=78915 RepID=A0A4P9XM89_9FUNG|nr:hypothetical protein THASP1DRAFT_24750 [Thamnocephalis sphaerospora]|eukprot:RKP07014.1 hypothetical protein THASP1DRAFT_24750 [Thamnocephalis sphaerospora]
MDGAFHRTADVAGGWVHAVCANWIPGVTLDKDNKAHVANVPVECWKQLLRDGTPGLLNATEVWRFVRETNRACAREVQFYIVFSGVVAQERLKDEATLCAFSDNVKRLDMAEDGEKARTLSPNVSTFEKAHTAADRWKNLPDLKSDDAFPLMAMEELASEDAISQDIGLMVHDSPVRPQLLQAQVEVVVPAVSIRSSSAAKVDAVASSSHQSAASTPTPAETVRTPGPCLRRSGNFDDAMAAAMLSEHSQVVLPDHITDTDAEQSVASDEDDTASVFSVDTNNGWTPRRRRRRHPGRARGGQVRRAIGPLICATCTAQMVGEHAHSGSGLRRSARIQHATPHRSSTDSAMLIWGRVCSRCGKVLL